MPERLEPLQVASQRHRLVGMEATLLLLLPGEAPREVDQPVEIGGAPAPDQLPPPPGQPVLPVELLLPHGSRLNGAPAEAWLRPHHPTELQGQQAGGQGGGGLLQGQRELLERSAMAQG